MRCRRTSRSTALSRVIPKNDPPDHAAIFNRQMKKRRFYIESSSVGAPHEQMCWVYSVCGLDATVRFIYWRLNNVGNYLPWIEREYLKRLMKRAVFIAKHDLKRDALNQDYVQLWEQLLSAKNRKSNRQLIVERSKLERDYDMTAVAPTRLASEPRPVAANGVSSRPVAAGLERNEADLLESPVLVKPAEPHSRKAKGECGERIGMQLDSLLQMIWGPRLEDETEWPDDEPLGLDELIADVRSEPLPVEITTASEDPPSSLGADIGADATAAEVGGNDSGFPLETEPVASLWDVLAGMPDQVTDAQQLLDDLSAKPQMRAAAHLQSLERVRGILRGVPESADLWEPVHVMPHDLLVLTNQLMSRLR